MLNQIVNLSEQDICNGKVSQRDVDLLKNDSRVKQLHMIEFYSILILCNHQLQSIALRCIFMVTMKNICFQKIYRCLYESIALSCLVQQKRVAWKKLGKKKIIFSLSILNYVTILHINIRRYLHSTRSCVIVSVFI